MRWGCYEGQDICTREDPGSAAFLVAFRTGYSPSRDWYSYHHEFVVTANSEEDAVARIREDMTATIEHMRESSPPEAFAKKEWQVDVGGLRDREYVSDGVYSEFDSATQRLREWIEVIDKNDPMVGKVEVERLNGCFTASYFDDYRGIINGCSISGTVQSQRVEEEEE